MIGIIFRPFTDNKDTFTSSRVAIINKILSFDYTEEMNGIGSFALTLPLDEELINKLQLEYILNVQERNNFYWLVVKKVETSVKENVVKISGFDLKIWLSYRIALYGKEQDTGTYGYDVIQGSTGECCNHYVNNNFVVPGDENRKIKKLVCDENNINFGLTNDSYMARFEAVSEIVKKLCKNAGIGFEIIGDLENNCYKFKLYDKKETNYIFSKNKKNITELSTIISNTDEKNSIYATYDEMTTLINREENASAGVYRKEVNINVSCDSIENIEIYARHDVADMVKTESINADVISTYYYDLAPGDIITIIDEMSGKTTKTYISSVKRSRSSNNLSLSIQTGESEIKLFDKIKNKLKTEM